MKLERLSLAVLSLAWSACWVAAQEPSSTKTGEVAEIYRLVWADEFNTDGPPNPDNWSFEQGFVRNEELQWYQPENARCVGGRLIIEGRRERGTNLRYEADSANWRYRREFGEYTSACLHSRQQREWLDGRLEMLG